MKVALSQIPENGLCALACGCLARARIGRNGQIGGWRLLFVLQSCDNQRDCVVKGGRGYALTPPQMLVEPLDVLSVALIERFE